MKKSIDILLLVVAMVMVMSVVLLDVKIDSMKPTPEADVVTETDSRQEQETEQLPNALPETPSNVSPTPAQTLEQQNVNFEFTVIGESNKSTFGDRYGMYRFDGSNVIVFTICWRDGGKSYLLGEDYGENKVPALSHIIPCTGEQFLALSNKYMLFLNASGRMAKDLREREEVRDGRTYLVHDTIPFEELPVEEQEAFVFPCSYEEVINDRSFNDTIEWAESTN